MGSERNEASGSLISVLIATSASDTKRVCSGPLTLELSFPRKLLPLDRSTISPRQSHFSKVLPCALRTKIQLQQAKSAKTSGVTLASKLADP
jgi:hypothetical protein